MGSGWSHSKAQAGLTLDLVLQLPKCWVGRCVHHTQLGLVNILRSGVFGVSAQGEEPSLCLLKVQQLVNFGHLLQRAHKVL